MAQVASIEAGEGAGVAIDVFATCAVRRGPGVTFAS
jgi:hypothetical protein